MLPTFIATKAPSPVMLSCACDMCFDLDYGCIQGIGPHDLHCVCPDCVLLASDDALYDSYLENRYPDQFADLHYYAWHDDDSEYEPPSNSPTNQEMHAVNGNLSHQHHSGYGDFLRAAGRGLAGSTNPADQFALAGLGSVGLLGGSLGYTSTQNMGKPLNELREQLWPTEKQPVDYTKPDNKYMHSYNGNKKGSDGGMIAIDEIVNGKLQKDLSGITDLQNSRDQWLKDHPKVIKPNYDPDLIDTIDMDTGILPQYPIDEDQDLSEVPVKQTKTGPTNKEMHITNGNIYGPANKGVTKKQNKIHLRKLKRKLNKAKKKGSNVIVKVNNNKPHNKSHRGVGKIVVKDKEEKKIAQIYTKFIKQPVIKPPKIGSTGNLPTKILHGYFEQVFNMNAPGFGGVVSTPCTDLIAFLSPKLQAHFTSVSDFTAPIVVGASTSSATPFVNTATTNGMTTLDFNNVTALVNEAGVSGNDLPLARVLGGHISLICRCPMQSVAPPYIFGGLLPSDTPFKGPSRVADLSQQLNQLTTTQIRILKSTTDVSGYEVSAVWTPSSSNDLQFWNNLCFQGGAGTHVLDVCPIPYVGMTGCPNTATVTIKASLFFEIQQTSLNYQYSGWSLGPSVESDLVFNYMPRNIRPVSARALQIGQKEGANAAAQMAMMIKQQRHPDADKTITVEELAKQLEEINNKIKTLTIKVPESDEEDEKYVYSDSPKYTSLSRSTIDLALQLKDKLTPGSVTSKTSRIVLP